MRNTLANRAWDGDVDVDVGEAHVVQIPRQCLHSLNLPLELVAASAIFWKASK